MKGETLYPPPPCQLSSRQQHSRSDRSPWSRRIQNLPIKVILTLVASGLVLTGLSGRILGICGKAPKTIIHHGSTPVATGDNSTSPSNWSWNDVEPRQSLNWEPCYDGIYDCARLDVPMDWQSPSPDHRVILAVMRLRATDTSSNYAGPLFFNPGGPGGSGVFALKNRGHLLQAIAGRNYDIVSFDPRGISASVPRIDCWGSPEQKQLWNLQDVGVVDAHPGLLNDAYFRAAALSQACEERMMRSSDILRHISTASHARDMLEILTQMGQEKLRYWGFSYGTYLGGIFASMYPDKVERFVSDGNVDYREWTLNEHINFVRDTDKVMHAFYVFCHAAGPSRCAFHGPSPEAIEARLAKLLDDIKKYPIIVTSEDGPGGKDGPDVPQIITWSHLKRLISRVLYQPNYVFGDLAVILQGLENRDGRPFYNFVRSDGKGEDETKICSLEAIPPTVPSFDEGNDEAFPAVSCADHPPETGTVEDFSNWADEIMSLSVMTGDVNVGSKLGCVGRRVRPKWRFDGPFEGNTSHPIMYIANMADNVTPLASATNNSAGFPGSVVLVQNSYGHTTLSAPSTCTARYIRQYFQEGTLPAEGTTCEPDYLPFEDAKSISDNEYDEVTQAVHALSEANWRFWPRMMMQ